MFTFPASRSFWKHPVLLWSLYLSISGAKGQDFQSPTSMPVACFFSITSKKPQEVSHDEVTRFYPSILQVSCSPGSSLSQFHKTCLLTCSSSWRRHIHTHTYIDTIINIAWSNTFYSSMCVLIWPWSKSQIQQTYPLSVFLFSFHGSHHLVNLNYKLLHSTKNA